MSSGSWLNELDCDVSLVGLEDDAMVNQGQVLIGMRMQ